MEREKIAYLKKRQDHLRGNIFFSLQKKKKKVAQERIRKEKQFLKTAV